MSKWCKFLSQRFKKMVVLLLPFGLSLLVCRIIGLSDSQEAIVASIVTVSALGLAGGLRYIDQVEDVIFVVPCFLVLVWDARSISEDARLLWMVAIISSAIIFIRIGHYIWKRALTSRDQIDLDESL